MRKGSNLYTGSVVVLDAKTGNYKTHYKIVPKDWHDWDVSGAPALIKTAAGKNIMLVAPKDGYLYGFDLSTQAMLYREPVTKVENADVEFAAGQPVHFCPGSIGGAEWNGPGYDPSNNLVMIGQVEWCTTVTLQKQEQLKADNRGPARRRSIRSTFGVSRIRSANGLAGSMRSTPIAANGGGGQRLIIRSRAA